jgi:signal transduction histidine kinase
MRAVLSFLAGRRLAGVGLALLVELLFLVALSFASPSATIGIPAAVAAAIAGTVAVVYGVGDGVAVAAAGAVAFAALGSWAAGELAAIGVWPLIVAAVGLFARRVERHRVALRDLVEDQENERRALALTLHDDSAQTLTAALLTLRAALPADEGTATQAARARDVIADTIQQLRRLALDLSPKALDDYGLGAALAHLAETTTASAVAFERVWDGRLPSDAEYALFRFAQAALAAAIEYGADPITVRLAGEHGRVAVSIAGHPSTPGASPPQLPGTLDERFRLLDGRVTATISGSGDIVLRADVPAQIGVVGHARGVA